MTFTLNKEQTRIKMMVGTLARIKGDANIFNIAKEQLLNGLNTNLSKEEILELVSVLSDAQEQFINTKGGE